MFSFLTLLSFAIVASGGVNSAIIGGSVFVHNIIGGTAAGKCDIPYITLVYVKKTDKSYQCGGSFIDNRHVLTAAHCVTGDVVKIYVLYGFLNKYFQKKYVTVSKNVPHPKFTISENSVVNDIAVLTLDEAVTFDDCVKPIRLASPNEEFIDSCKLAGWGKTKGLDSSSSIKLLYADVPIVKPSICKKEADSIKDQHLCAGDMKTNGKTSCVGDSGGPLSCTSADDGETVLAGVISYGWDCTNGLSVMTKVSHFKDWIEKELQ